MASYYVYSGAAGAGTGADWANAYTTMSTAVSGKAAGDVFYVAHDHAESAGSSTTITSPGTAANPCSFYCVNRAGSVPPVSADLRTTATVSTTGASDISINGSGIWDGFTFNIGTAANSPQLFTGGTNSIHGYRNCQFAILATGVFAVMNLPSTGTARVFLENTSLKFSNTGHQITPAGPFVWRNTASAVQGTVPNALFAATTNAISLPFIEGVDLSALGSGKSLMTALTGDAKVTFKDCKLGASVAVPSPTLAGGIVRIIRSDSADTNYRSEQYTVTGTLTTETTIVRTGGASDGTTAIAWKIVTTANSRWAVPFECLPITIWNETTGSAITVTVQGIWGGGAAPNNDEIWIDVEYLGTSGFPLASKATSSKADGLATGSAIPAGSGTWGGSTTKFAMSATFTPQEKGPLTIYVRAAKASSTFYVDPQPVIT